MPTNNNNLPVRVFVKEYLRILSTAFDVKNAFLYATDALQTLDGITENATAFTVKTNNTPVVVNNYNKDLNVGMGTGTSNSNRFGPINEIIYGDTDVPYDYELSIHEGIDRATVNLGLDQAVADRLKLQAIAQVKRMNARIGAYISANAGEKMTLADMSQESVTDVFNKLYAYFVNKEVSATLTAYVTPDVYNVIVDNGLATTAKNSTVSIDDNIIYMFKGFKIVATPESYFAEGDNIYAMADGIIIPFVGANTTRTIESVDFDGVQLQSRAKGGTFITDDNKVAMVKVTAE